MGTQLCEETGQRAENQGEMEIKPPLTSGAQPLNQQSVCSSQDQSYNIHAVPTSGSCQLLTLICIVFGLQLQLTCLKLIMFYLDLQFFLLLLQGIFKFNEFLCKGKTKDQKVTAALYIKKPKFKNPRIQRQFEVTADQWWGFHQILVP